MNKRWIGLGTLLVLIGVGYIVLFMSRSLPPIEVMYLEPPGGKPLFSFNDELVFDEVKVVRPAVEPPANAVYVKPESKTVWHLVPDVPEEGEEARRPRPRSVVIYGQGMRGMGRPEGIPYGGLPLEEGVEHVFTASFDEGKSRAEITFTPGKPQ